MNKRCLSLCFLWDRHTHHRKIHEEEGIYIYNMYDKTFLPSHCTLTSLRCSGNCNNAVKNILLESDALNVQSFLRCLISTTRSAIKLLATKYMFLQVQIITKYIFDCKGF